MTPIEIQGVVWDSFNEHEHLRATLNKQVVALKSLNDPEFSCLFGNHALNIREFVNEVHECHPDLDTEIFGDNLQCLIEHVQYAHKSSHSCLFDKFVHLTVKMLPMQKVRKIMPPSKSLKDIRLIGDEDLRWELRSKRQPIDMSHVGYRDDKVYKFEIIARRSPYFDDHITKINEMIPKYETTGLHEMGIAAQAAVKDMQTLKAGAYYGFLRCSLQSAVSSIIERLHLTRYRPVATPVNRQDANDLIHRLESMPEAGGFPIFDHYFMINGAAEVPLLGEVDGKCYFLGFNI